MNKAVRSLIILTLGVIIFGFNSKSGGQPQELKVEQKNSSNIDKDLGLKFLKGIQDGDKKIMYEATNLTTDIVNDSREKLIYTKKYKITELQRQEYEHVLRISGQVDFFLAKTRKMFPSSSRIEITQTAAKRSADDTRHMVHRVTITYMSKDDAMRDKKGKAVKEMVVHLQQLTRSANGRSLQEFSFSGKDFEKIADKDFEVLSYY